MPMAPPRRRSPSVEASWRPERRHSRDREKHRSTSRHRQRDRSAAPDSRRGRPNFTTSSRHSNYQPARDSSKEARPPQSRTRPIYPPQRISKATVFRSDRPAPARQREDSVSSVKRRRETSTSPTRERVKKHRRHSPNSKLSPSRSPLRSHREERSRRDSPDTYIPRHRSQSRDSTHRKSRRSRSPPPARGPSRSFGDRPAPHEISSHKFKDQERWETNSGGFEYRGYHNNERSGRGHRIGKSSGIRSPRRRFSPPRGAPRQRSPPFRRPRSPIDRKSSFRSRDSSSRVELLPEKLAAKQTSSPHHHSPPGSDSRDHERRPKDREGGHRRWSSRSPADERRQPPHKRFRDDKERKRSRSRERQTRQDASKSRHRTSRTPEQTTTPNDDMSWRPPYDHRGPPSRGGWPQQDPRYSHTPPFNNYHGSPQGPHQPAFSPQQSPYPPQSGHPDPNYFHGQQQSPPFNRAPHHQSPPYQHSSSPQQAPNGSYPTRGGYRGAQPPYNQRFPQPPQVQTAGPHVRNLSWTPKTGTRGGHAPTVHGAALQAANAESTTPSQEQPNIFNGTDNPFRPASKDLRVDDEAGKTGKSQGPEDSTNKTATDASQQHSPQIRFGLPKTGIASAVVKPNAFEKKRNPFEQQASAAATPTNDRFIQRQNSQYDSRPSRDLDRRREDYPPRPRGPKSSLKQSDRTRFHDRRRPIPPVKWNPLPPPSGDKELHKKLRSLRSLVLSKGHSLKELQWCQLRPAPEPVEEDDPPGLVQAMANMALLEEEAYRDHPNKRPKGKVPLLKEGEVLDKDFTKDVVAVKYKIRRPQKILPEEYRNSNVYYRKPGNESVVGFGTYGKVFKAKHIYKGKDVALKRLRMEAEKDGFPITAMREMKILKHLEQREADGVIRLLEVLYEVNLAGSVGCFMAFEYMPHDLTGLLNHPTFSLSDAQKKDLSYQMIDAIGFMHRQGVLHRDIKAANILVSHKGQIKLADFGLARFYDMDKQLHYTNRVVTIWYRAPELLYGQTEYGPPIDVWAAACVIVEIFTKHAIFPGSGRELNQLLKLWEVLGFPTEAQWPAVSKTEWYFMMRPKEEMVNTFAEKYEERVSPALFEILSSMLQYDPDKRPTAEECLEHPFFKQEEPTMEAVSLEELGDWHELESKRARKQREADERWKKELDHDYLYGPPSCGQHIGANRRDREYKKIKLEKRSANFSPAEPEAKKIKA